jgi:hypothetical protein
MIGFGLVLLTVSLADIGAGGLIGLPRKGLRAFVAVVLAIGTCCAAAFCLEVSSPKITTALGAAASIAWVLAKFPWRRGLSPAQNHERPQDGTTESEDEESLRHPRLALLALAVPLMISLVVARPDSPPGFLDEWLQSSPFAAVRSMQGSELVLLCGVLLFLTAPANSIIRAVLTTVMETPVSRSETRLRGGRLIGVLERWLIFGLAIAGEPTAAALIVSAKSLLRFPEISKMQKDSPDAPTDVSEIDTITEYFLLGSLLSWTIALAPVVLLSRLSAHG